MQGDSIAAAGELTDGSGVKSVQSLSFDRGLNRAVAGCSDRLLRVWDLERWGASGLPGAAACVCSLGACSGRPPRRRRRCRCCRRPASQSDRPRAASPRRRCCIGRLGGLTDEPQAHQFDAARVAASALDGSLLLWDTRMLGGSSPSGTSSSSVAAPVLRLKHKCPLHAFQMHGDRLVSGEWDGSVNVWDLRKPGASLARFEGQGLGHAERVWAVAMDQYRAVTGGLDHKLQVLSFV